MANYGTNKRPNDEVADFLLGGNRKRLIVERLAGKEGYSANQLVCDLRIGRATVFETLRALRSADALDDLADDAFRLTSRTKLGCALRALVTALGEVGTDRVDRPPRPRTSKGSRKLRQRASRPKRV